MGLGRNLVGRRKDGSEFALDVSLGPFRGEDGPLVWCIVRDVTLHKQLAAEKAFSERLVQVAPTVILLLDPNGRILQINPYTESLTGYRADEVVGRDWFTTFVPETDRAELRRLFHRVLDEGVNPGHTNAILTKGGAQRQVEWRAQTLLDADGDVVGLLNVGHDVTERLAADAALRRAEAALLEADRRKDAFLATLAHELRSPLNAITTGLELGRLANDPATVERADALVRRQVAQLTRLVDDLLDVSRINRGRVSLQLRTVDLRDVVRDAIEDTRHLVAQAEQQLEVDLPEDPLELEIDGIRIGQVLGNLLRNAVKYTPAGGHLRVSVRPLDGGAELAVSDDGLGLPPEKLDAVFDMFEQLDRGSGAGGMGIGLSLARSLVELHGGTVRAASDGPGLGSVFRVWLPPRAADPDTTPSASTPDSLRVLIAERSREHARRIAAQLSALGHRTRLVSDGVQAVELCSGFHPHVVVLDVTLPRLNGYDLARWIRAQTWGGDVRLVGILDADHAEQRARAADAGFDELLDRTESELPIHRLLSITSGSARRGAGSS
jgi:PAS domain S-box-containing protein